MPLEAKIEYLQPDIADIKNWLPVNESFFRSSTYQNFKGQSTLFTDERYDSYKQIYQNRVRNCDQLVTNATENLVLATRISRPVASRRLTFSIVSLF